jgi:hypothetical protein
MLQQETFRKAMLNDKLVGGAVWQQILHAVPRTDD